jgi:uncharacterized protein (TIGR03083 family)
MSNRKTRRQESRRIMRDERRDLRQFLPTLNAEQWQTPSLCRGWTVRDVVAHMVAWDDVLLYKTRRQHFQALLRFVGLYVRSFGSMAALNRKLDRLVVDATVEELLQRFGADDSPGLKWLFDGSNPGGHLAEYLIHDQDIRIPLGLERDFPPDRLVAALEGVGNLPGVRLGVWRRKVSRRWTATDVDWSAGRGAPTSDTGLAILLTLANRRSS